MAATASGGLDDRRRDEERERGRGVDRDEGCPGNERDDDAGRGGTAGYGSETTIHLQQDDRGEQEREERLE